MATTAALIMGGSALAGGALSSKGSGGGATRMPKSYREASGQIASDIRGAMAYNPTALGHNFDARGNLMNPFVPGSFQPTGNWFADTVRRERFRPGMTPLSANNKALFESMNFFGNLYNNPDIERSLDVYRQRLQPGANGLVSDPIFNIVRERGTAQAIEAGRRLGGLQSSGTGRGVADFLTTAEAQQRTYEDERAATASDRLYQMLFARGQAGFLPTQMASSSLSALGGAMQFPSQPQFSNTKGQAGEIAGSYLGSILKKNPSSTTGGTTIPGAMSNGQAVGTIP